MMHVYPSSSHDAEVEAARERLKNPTLRWGKDLQGISVDNADLSLLLADHARLESELERVQRSPELEWEKVKEKILAVLARIARESGRDYALEMQAALDAGSVYVDRLNARIEDAAKLRKALYSASYLFERIHYHTLDPWCGMESREEIREKATQGHDMVNAALAALEEVQNG
jgi:hypothetical protein